MKNSKTVTPAQRAAERVLAQYGVHTVDQARWHILFTHIFAILQTVAPDVKQNRDTRHMFYRQLKALDRYEAQQKVKK